MTWLQVKKAAEEAGVKDNDEIFEIHCEMQKAQGDKTFHKMSFGQRIKLVENPSQETLQENSSGCTC